MFLISFFIITSMLLGSAIGKMLSTILVHQKGINLFTGGLSQNIPSFNFDLSQLKTMDILDFVFFILISVALFAFFYFLYRNKKFTKIQQILLGLLNVVFALFVFIATSFASYSGFQTLIFIVIWYIGAYLISIFLPKEVPEWKTSKHAALNGIVAGFYLLIILNNITTSVALPLAIFPAVPFIFYLFSKKIKVLDNPAFLLLVFSFIFPFNRAVLASVGVIAIIACFILKDKISQRTLSIIDKIYPAIILFIFVYNPVFYLGNFDTIEEGFWAGWLERLINGQLIYKDFAAYHPPLLLYGLFAFTKMFGFSLYNLRLYFHILQISGLIIIYYTLNVLVESKWLKIGLFAVILAYSEGLVRNNMEIRVGSAILPLLFVYLFMIKQKTRFLFMAGIFSSVAFLVSIETGIASLAATGMSSVLLSKRQTILKNTLTVGAGMLAVLTPFFAILAIGGALPKFFEDIIYYTTIFSNGYLNTPMDRPPLSTLIQWYIVGQFVQSTWLLFILTEFSIVATFCIFIVKKLRKDLDPKIIFATSLAILAFVLSRSALGRSDGNHVDFVWIIALITIGYMLHLMRSFSKELVVGILFILIFFVAHDITQGTLIQNQLIKFQTYGNPSGGYPSYSSSRAGIITGIDVNPKDTDDLVKFVDSNVSKNEKIFVFPQEPEIYFLTDRVNSTSFDTPLAFYTISYQEQILDELKQNPPKLIIYNKTFQIPGLTVDTLHEVNKYIITNFHIIKTFGKEDVMVKGI